MVTNIDTAELIKHASNSFLALKISYINLIANLCDKTEANIEQVAQGMGLDPRIGGQFLKAGIGYGGSCFPKDIKALVNIGEELGVDMSLLKEADRINLDRMARLHRQDQGGALDPQGQEDRRPGPGLQARDR